MVWGWGRDQVLGSLLLGILPMSFPCFYGVSYRYWHRLTPYLDFLVSVRGCSFSSHPLLQFLLFSPRYYKETPVG